MLHLLFSIGRTIDIQYIRFGKYMRKVSESFPAALATSWKRISRILELAKCSYYIIIF